jgi:hypothetical protein
MQSARDTDDGEPQRRDTGGPSFYERAIRTGIGRGLRRYYDLSEPIPDDMLRLLDQIDEQSKPAAAESNTQADSQTKSDGGEPGTQ